MTTDTPSHASLDLQITRAERPDHEPLRRMVELYMHDFSEFDGEDLDEHGLFGYSSLDYYWHEPAHYAYIFRVNGRFAGFALVNDDVIHSENQFWMAEFFVLRKYRKAGIGRAAAQYIFDAHPGRWEVGQRNVNASSTVFWRSVILAYTDGQLQEISLDNDEWQGTVHIFRAGKEACSDGKIAAAEQKDV